MISALNMEFEIVRTVLKNDANEISVCIDAKRDSGAHYTILSIFSKSIAKDIAERMAVDGLFSQNSDFVGSFTLRDALHLVFHYHPESRLANKEALYAGSFAKRKGIALSFLTALAETEIRGDIGRLLITDENVNISSGGKVYLNYFLDFKKFTPSPGQDDFYRDAARFAFEILSREYAEKYEQQTELYPNELRLMYKKTQNRAFKSYSQLMAFIKTLSDTPREQRVGIMRLLGVFEGIRSFLFKNPANLFLTVVVVITLGYLGYQLMIRALAEKSTKENTVYVGMQTIGEVYLGEENV